MYLIDKYNEKTSLKTNSDLTFRQETSKIAALAVKAVGKHDSPQPGLYWERAQRLSDGQLHIWLLKKVRRQCFKARICFVAHIFKMPNLVEPLAKFCSNKSRDGHSRFFLHADKINQRWKCETLKNCANLWYPKVGPGGRSVEGETSLYTWFDLIASTGFRRGASGQVMSVI